MIRFITKTFSELSTAELYQLLKLRAEVFVVEQNCAYLDMDDKDFDSFHVLGYDTDVLAAYCRLVPAGVSYKEPSIGRVVTSPLFRNLGYGKQLMNYSIPSIKNKFNTKNIVISAQQYLEVFYTELGFAAEGTMYLEDEIPHIKMRHLH